MLTDNRCTTMQQPNCNDLFDRDGDDSNMEFWERTSKKLQRMARDASASPELRENNPKAVRFNDDILKEARNLMVGELIKILISHIEKELMGMLSRPALRREVGEAFDPLLLSSMQKRLMSEKIAVVRDAFGRFLLKADPSNVKPKSSDILSIQSLMETVENGLLEIKKNKMKGASVALLAEEKRLVQDICFYEHRLAQQETSRSVVSCVSVSVDDNSTKSGKLLSSKEESAPDILKYHDFVAKHGMYGGWDDLSHAAFMKLRTKYGANSPSFIPACASTIPGISMLEAKTHEEWFRKFSSLFEAKKKSAYGASKAELETALTTVEPSIEDKRQQKEQEEREKRRDLIEKWKEEQQHKKDEAEKQASLLKEKEEALEKKRKEERLSLRQVVAEYTREKTELEVLQRICREEEENKRRRENALMAAEEIKRFKSKDKEFLKKRKETEYQNRLREVEREQRLQKLKAKVVVKIERDPARILRPTQGYQHRLASPRHIPEETVHKNFSAIIIPKRHMPSWRKGL
ncbi:hypothetical protein BC829DRAFT_383026 [Chytridium lagenaria]|nr:hypothetical protein BC829DRAFT_383026 [Chytridium lagenaria]